MKKELNAAIEKIWKSEQNGFFSKEEALKRIALTTDLYKLNLTKNDSEYKFESLNGNDDWDILTFWPKSTENPAALLLQKHGYGPRSPFIIRADCFECGPSTGKETIYSLEFTVVKKAILNPNSNMDINTAQVMLKEAPKEIKDLIKKD